VAPAGTVSYYTGTTGTMDFEPARQLAPDTTYTATVAAVVKDLAGNAMAHDYVWSFTTGFAPPTVAGTAPANNATLIPPNIQSISADFSEPVVLNSVSFTLSCTSPCVKPTGTVSLDSNFDTATFSLTHGTILEPFTSYTVTIKGAKSIATGVTMADTFVSNFMTGPIVAMVRPRVMTTFPVTSASGPTAGVPANVVVGVAFSEHMDPTTINSSTFTVTCSTPCVSPDGIVDYDATSATVAFEPATALTVGATYTATLKSTITDDQGNALAGNQAAFPAASDYVWTFIAGNSSSPTPVAVIGIDPINGATNVCPSSNVDVLLSLPTGSQVDPATVNTSTFFVTGPGPSFTPVPAASVARDPTGTDIEFTPLNPLTPGVTYTVSIKGGATGVKDESLPANQLNTVLVTWSFTVGTEATCSHPVNLGAAISLAVGATAGITNSSNAPDTLIMGDVGMDPIATCNGVAADDVGGFGPCGGDQPAVDGIVITPIYPAPGLVAQGLADLQAAYLSITPPASPSGDGTLGGGTPIDAPTSLGGAAGSTLILGVNYFTPGVYTAVTSIGISGDITLDGQNRPDAVFVFQSAGNLTLADGAVSPGAHTRIRLINGAQASNVWWQVGGSATIGSYAEFLGNVLSASDITLKTGASVCGRVLAGIWVGGSGSVALDSNMVSVPGGTCLP